MSFVFYKVHLFRISSKSQENFLSIRLVNHPIRDDNKIHRLLEGDL